MPRARSSRDRTPSSSRPCARTARRGRRRRRRAGRGSSRTCRRARAARGTAAAARGPTSSLRTRRRPALAHGVARNSGAPARPRSGTARRPCGSRWSRSPTRSACPQLCGSPSWRGSGIAGPRAKPQSVRILLDRVRQHPGDSGDREDRRRRSWQKSHCVGQPPDREVDVRRRQPQRGGRLDHRRHRPCPLGIDRRWDPLGPAGDRPADRGRGRPGVRSQRGARRRPPSARGPRTPPRARWSGRASTRRPPARRRATRLRAGPVRPARPGRGRPTPRPPPGRRASTQPARDRRAGPDRRRPRPAAPAAGFLAAAQRSPKPGGSAAVGGLRGGRQPVEHAGQDPGPGEPYGLGAAIGAPRIGRPQRSDHDRDPVDGRSVRRQRRRQPRDKLRGGCVELPGRGGGAVPQQPGDALEGRETGQLDGVLAAVVQPARRGATTSPGSRPQPPARRTARRRATGSPAARRRHARTVTAGGRWPGGAPAAPG